MASSSSSNACLRAARRPASRALGRNDPVRTCRNPEEARPKRCPLGVLLKWANPLRSGPRQFPDSTRGVRLHLGAEALRWLRTRILGPKPSGAIRRDRDPSGALRLAAPRGGHPGAGLPLVTRVLGRSLGPRDPGFPWSVGPVSRWALSRRIEPCRTLRACALRGSAKVSMPVRGRNPNRLLVFASLGEISRPAP